MCVLSVSGLIVCSLNRGWVHSYHRRQHHSDRRRAGLPRAMSQPEARTQLGIIAIAPLCVFPFLLQRFGANNE